MTPDEIQSKIKDIITNHIRSAEDPAAGELVRSDLHDVLTAKMREKVLGKVETPAADVTVDDDSTTDDDEEPTE